MRLEIVDLAQLNVFWIAFARVITVLFQLPLWEEVGVTNIVKILTALIITYVMYPLVSSSILNDMSQVGEQSFAFLSLYYGLTGLVIGYLVRNINITIMAAGTMISQQMGLGSVALFDPSSMTQVGPIERLMRWSLIMIVLSYGCMLPMMKGIYLSFFSISYTSASHLSLSMDFFIDFFKDLFLMSILLASPIVFINVLINVILGVVSRFVPQLNVIVVSFAVNILAGFAILMVASSEILSAGSKYYTDYLGKWFLIVK